MGLVPGQHREACCDLSAGGEPCLQSVKNATPVKHKKGQLDETRCAWGYLKANGETTGRSDFGAADVGDSTTLTTKGA